MIAISTGTASADACPVSRSTIRSHRSWPRLRDHRQLSSTELCGRDWRRRRRPARRERTRSAAPSCPAPDGSTPADPVGGPARRSGDSGSTRTSVAVLRSPPVGGTCPPAPSQLGIDFGPVRRPECASLPDHQRCHPRADPTAAQQLEGLGQLTRQRLREHDMAMAGSRRHLACQCHLLGDPGSEPSRRYAEAPLFPPESRGTRRSH